MSIICFVEECNSTCAANEYHATLLICGLWTSGTGWWVDGKDIESDAGCQDDDHCMATAWAISSCDTIQATNKMRNCSCMGLDPNSNSTNKEHANWTKAYDDCVLDGGWILMLVDQCTT